MWLPKCFNRVSDGCKLVLFVRIAQKFDAISKAIILARCNKQLSVVPLHSPSREKSRDADLFILHLIHDLIQSLKECIVLRGKHAH